MIEVRVVDETVVAVSECDLGVIDIIYIITNSPPLLRFFLATASASGTLVLDVQQGDSRRHRLVPQRANLQALRTDANTPCGTGARVLPVHVARNGAQGRALQSALAVGERRPSPILDRIDRAQVEVQSWHSAGTRHATVATELPHS
eukprot:COSAG01_NODE_24_length_37608_cov_19.303154_10_plen_147_part_00